MDKMEKVTVESLVYIAEGNEYMGKVNGIVVTIDPCLVEDIEVIETKENQLVQFIGQWMDATKSLFLADSFQVVH